MAINLYGSRHGRSNGTMLTPLWTASSSTATEGPKQIIALQTRDTIILTRLIGCRSNSWYLMRCTLHVAVSNPREGIQAR